MVKLASGRPVTSGCLGVVREPVLESDVGASGTKQCCFEHELQILSEEAPAGGPVHRRAKEG